MEEVALPRATAEYWRLARVRVWGDGVRVLFTRKLTASVHMSSLMMTTMMRRKWEETSEQGFALARCLCNI